MLTDILCPNCGSPISAHSGDLHQETPDSPILDPPVELRVCSRSGCRVMYRADGVPYNEEACRLAWINAANRR